MERKSKALPEFGPVAGERARADLLCPKGEYAQTVDPLASAWWDERLNVFPTATFFHTAAWARVLHETYGFRPEYLFSGPAESPVAVLPLMEVRSWLTGRRGVSLPFTDECGLVGQDPAAMASLGAAAVERAKAARWRHLEIRGGREHFSSAPASTSFHAHTVDLTGSESTLLDRTEPSVKRAIRKAGQSGLTIEVSHTIEATRQFHRLLGLTRQKHGMPLQPFDFFRHIQRHVLAQGKGCIVLAKQGSAAVAGALFFHFKQTSLFKFGASDHRLQHLRANNLVMWEAIKWHAQHGFAHLDLGRTSLSNEGLRKFKLGWGSRERRLDYVKYDCRANRWTTAPDRSSGWHSSLFRHVPRTLSCLAGSLLYRHLA